MSRSPRAVLIVVVAMVVAVAAMVRRVEAQLTTADRQFHNATAFPLDGKHRTLACESCHVGNTYKGTPTRCFDCHWTRRQDDRYRLQLGTQCEQCHRSTTWAATQWDHNVMTAMPLGVAHRQLTCTSCHTSNGFKGTQVTCASCHLQNYQATRTPNHGAAGFPTNCEVCHRVNDTRFTQARFDHQASYPLVGNHAQATCATCHRSNVFKGTPRDCVGCHQGQYQRTTTPNHVAAGFPTTCENCHRPSDPSFKGANFNHNQTFNLVGRHAQATCASCHVNNVFKGTPRDCVGCHQGQYQRTTTPNHVAAGFPTTCENCHRPSDPSFKGANFNHNQTFNLVGRHAQATCASCHVNNVFKGTPRDCVGCHQGQYQRTTTPNHVAAGFPTTCENCHRPSDPSFKGANFNHNQTFNLVGRHAQATCASCHVNNVFKGTPQTCIGCHQSQYDRTTTPNHRQSGFSTACESCHQASAASFKGANFNHNQTFNLVGRHAQATCASCHVNNVFKGTPRTCVGCHQSNYDRTSNPNHRTAGFPTVCENCHKNSDSSWGQGVFSHRFNINSGPHNTTCANCHTTGGSFAVFNCLMCHTKPKMDDKHKERNGYRYDSPTCYGCHPTGRE